MVCKIAIGVSVSAELIAIVTIVIMTTLAYLSYCCVGELIMSAWNELKVMFVAYHNISAILEWISFSESIMEPLKISQVSCTACCYLS